MRSQRILYLDAHQVAAYTWQAGALACDDCFAATDTGIELFSRYLAANKDRLFTLLVNVADEGFHPETIPYLRGRDRHKVIARKLEQTFFNTPLTAAISRGHEKNRRKDERLLLAALTQPSLLQPWLDALHNVGAALSGLYSLPFLGQALLRKLQVPTAPCLLLSVQDQSVRQSYFDGGELHFSRLTTLQHRSIGSVAQTLATESAKLQQYLVSQRLIGRSQTLTAYIVAPGSTVKSLETSCVDTASLRYQLLDLEDCAQQIGLHTFPSDAQAEALFLHLLITQPPDIQFAGEALRHDFRVHQVRNVVLGAAALSLITGLLLAGKLLFDAHEIAQESAVLREEAALSRQRYDTVVATLPIPPAEASPLRRAIDAYVNEAQRSTTPMVLYQDLSRALQNAPSIDIARLDWRIGGTNMTDNKPSAPPALAAELQQLTVHGQLRVGLNTSPRQTLADFDRFLIALRTNPRLSIELLQAPLDLSSGSALRSADASGDSDKPREFILSIARKIAP